MTLNEGQRAAVEAPIDRPLLVLAAAGSGKTQVLTTRLRRLVCDLGVPDHEVLAMTFTRKAAAEMRHRAGERLSRVLIGTFHSVCVRILRVHSLLVDLSPDFKIVNSASRDGGRKHDVVPISDLVSLALLALRRGATVPWRFVLVDEFQDTDDSQFDLVRLLSHGGRYLTVVGDDYQAIHGWRGARVENLLEFTHRLAAHRPGVVRLEMNYRSRPFILAAASALIAHNWGQCPKELLPTRDDVDDHVRLVVCPGGADEEAARVVDLAQDKRRSDETVAVLFRTNAATEPVERALREAGVPYTVKGSYRFFARKEVKDALAYVRCVLGVHGPEDVKRALQCPARGVGPASIAKLEALARASDLGGDLLEIIPHALELRAFPEGGKVANGVRSFLAFLDELRDLRSDPPAVIRAVVSLLVSEEVDVERSGNLLQLSRCVQASYTTLQALLSDAGDEDGSGDEAGQEPAGPEAPLTLLTMHASKGLEFDHVILTGMAGGVFPSLWGTTDLGEERRLCYVGVTRARDRLSLTCPGDKLSRFVREMRAA